MEESDQGAERKIVGWDSDTTVASSAVLDVVMSRLVQQAHPTRVVARVGNRRHTSAHKRRPAFTGGHGQDYGRPEGPPQATQGHGIRRRLGLAQCRGSAG